MKPFSEVLSEIEQSRARIFGLTADMMLATAELLKSQFETIADLREQIADLKKQNAELSHFINTHYEAKGE